MLDGWTTSPSQPCLFGCARGQDDIRHYAYCPCVARLWASRLDVHLEQATARLDTFLLLDTAPAVSAAPRALGLYATFKATNAARNGIAAAEGAWHQALIEGGPLRQ